MNKVILVIAICILSISAANAKKLSLSDNNFNKGDFVIGPYVGLYDYLGYGFGAQAELGITDIIGIGNIGVGADVSLGHWTDNIFGLSDYYTSYNDINFLVFATYHFKIIKNKMFDPYAKLGLGLQVQTYSRNLPDSYNYYYGIYNYDIYQNDKSGSNVHFHEQAEVGMRFFFGENFALRAFVGYPWIGVGADFKF